MTKKKKNLQNNSLEVGKNASFEEQTWSLYPPVIEASKAFDFNYNLSDEEVSPPTFNKEKFKTIKNSDSESKSIESLNEFNSRYEEIDTLKNIRKNELGSLVKIKSDRDTLESIRGEAEKKLVFEEEKNSNYRKSLTKVNDEVSNLSRSIDELKNTRVNFEIENTSLEKELSRLELTKEESESTISELGKKNGLLAEKLALYHRDINDLQAIHIANIGLIKDYKNQISLNKAKVDTLLSDIEEKNRDIDQTHGSIEHLRDSVKEAEDQVAELRFEYGKVENEYNSVHEILIFEKNKRDQLEGKIAKVKEDSTELGVKTTELNIEHKNLESKCFSLEEDLKMLSADVSSKKSIVDAHESKIFQAQKMILNLEKQKSETESSLIKRKQELHKLSRIYKLKVAKVEHLDNENFSLRREIETVLSLIEEAQFHKSTAERKISEQKSEKEKNEISIASYKKELEDLNVFNSDIDKNILIVKEDRQASVENLSKIKKECEKLSDIIDVKKIQLSRIRIDEERQAGQVLGLKNKKQNYSDTFQKLGDEFQEIKYSLKQKLKDKRHLSKELVRFQSDLTLKEEKLNKYTQLVEDLKSEKIRIFDEKISIEQKSKYIATSLQQTESELYTERNIVSTIQGELDDTIKRSHELDSRLSSTKEQVAILEIKRNEISNKSELAANNKRKLEADIHELERTRSSLESEIMRDHEAYSELNSRYLAIEAKNNRIRSSIEDFKEQKSKLISQIETRSQLILKKNEECSSLSKESQTIDMEIDSLNNEFRRFNAKLIDNNLNVTNLRESIKEKKVDLQSLKSKYKSLTKDTEELGLDMNQQRILINELERTKSQYLNMIEDIMNKKDNEHRNIADGVQYIDRLKKDIVALKDNVYNLKSTKKKAA